MSHARLPIRVALLFAVALFAGCQSSVERDVVEREMRQQEDKIYALQDYLSEYQQLLCDARCENATLKRQMVQEQFRAEGPSKEKAGESDTLRSPPATSPTPPPGANEPEVAPSVTPPEVPPLDLSNPGVPPLKDQSANEPERREHEVQPAVAEIEVVGEAATAVVLRGEVRLDDNSSGPRVLVEVEPVDGEGQLVDFRGSLSLLVLDPAAREKEQQLARWDFQPDDLQPLTKRTKYGSSFEFPLQLPADVPTNRAVELWVRLMPEDGEKLLGRTTMDLSRAGQFASVEVQPAEKKPNSIHIAPVEALAVPHRRQAVRTANSNVRQSGWQTARPGEVTKPQVAAAKAASEWKMATGPIPVAESTSVEETKPIRNYLPPSVKGDPYGDAESPDWSPVRSSDNEAESQQQPAWSPTR